MGVVTPPHRTSHEARHIERLHSYSILDTPREPQFDRFVYTAAQMFRVPIAVLSLADSDRFWFKASVGLDITEVDRTVAFCEHLTADGVLNVEDASLDPRFSNAPLVTGAPYARFYAGAPLVTPDGLLVGSLSVIDRYPKTLLTRQSWQLLQLANGVVSALEARRSS
jgi:GAF domain-containing protein